ncbi:MAG: hypothetical protein ABW221_01390 [Vicinamibacteria bacterium]
MALLPDGYSFFMFQPAMPPSAVGAARLLIANLFLYAAALGAVVAAGRLAVAGFRRGRLAAYAGIALVFAHPLLQPVFFERLDTMLNYRWWEDAKARGVMGKTAEETRQILGDPASSEGDGSTRALWRYKPLPFYWLGSTGEVVFERGRAVYLEPNDD